jgi:hypothetical protein
MLHEAISERPCRKTFFKGGERVTVISDETMREWLAKTKAYAAVIVREGPNWQAEDARAILWEHGRRNFEAIMASDPAVKAGVLTFEIHGCRGFPGDALA